MRWSASFGLFLLSRTATALATPLTEPVVFYYDPPSSSSSADTAPESVDPETARLIFAQRLGLSRFHSLGSADELALRQISAYGGESQQLFGGSAQDNDVARALVIIEGIRETPDEVPNTTRYPSLRNFTISETPSKEHNDALFHGLYSQAKSTSRSGDNAISRAVLEIEGSFPTAFAYQACDEGSWRLEENVVLGHLDCPYTAITASTVLSNVHARATELDIALTVVMMPLSPSKASKKANPYGSLDEADGSLKRRDEFILSEAASTAAGPKPTANAASKASPKVLATSSAYPFVPQCFASASDCETGTGNCTGHGECIKKPGSAASKDESAGDCYVCSCNKPEVIKNKDGSTKTTFFGGSACQKKDISAPFWILTLTAGSLLALVGFGVSMLYAMGNAELPSVIGAGVSGPRPK